MINYVVGFAFDRYDAVTLIKKEKPAWQKGKWNGVGGKVQPGEHPSSAIAREFLEETGMRTSPAMWRYVARIIEKECVVYVYTTRVPILRVHTATNEQVRVFPENDQYILGGESWPCITNIPVLLGMCRLGPDPRGNTAFFTLDYTNDLR